MLLECLPQIADPRRAQDQCRFGSTVVVEAITTRLRTDAARAQSQRKLITHLLLCR